MTKPARHDSAIDIDYHCTATNSVKWGRLAVRGLPRNFNDRKERFKRAY
jgi:hypothetical protein